MGGALYRKKDKTDTRAFQQHTSGGYAEHPFSPDNVDTYCSISLSEVLLRQQQQQGDCLGATGEAVGNAVCFAHTMPTPAPQPTPVPPKGPWRVEQTLSLLCAFRAQHEKHMCDVWTVRAQTHQTHTAHNGTGCCHRSRNKKEREASWHSTAHCISACPPTTNPRCCRITGATHTLCHIVQHHRVGPPSCMQPSCEAKGSSTRKADTTTAQQ